MLIAAFDPYPNRGVSCFAYAHSAREGRAMAKDMSAVYFEMTTKNLLKLRSKKVLEIQRLENEARGMLKARDERVLRQQVLWINAVLESRNCQIGMFD